MDADMSFYKPRDKVALASALYCYRLEQYIEAVTFKKPADVIEKCKLDKEDAFRVYLRTVIKDCEERYLYVTTNSTR